DRVVAELEHLLSTGKFFTIFAFLFGLSFAIQLENAGRKGTAFAGRFAWRLTLLLAIGFVHGLFYSGDILLIYAVLGFLLIPLRRVPTRWLLVIALLLVFNIPGLLLNLKQLNSPPPTPQELQADMEQGKQFMALAQRQYDIKRSGTLGEVLKMNLT